MPTTRLALSGFLFLFALVFFGASGSVADDQNDLDAVIEELVRLNTQLQRYQSEQSDLESEMRNQEVELSRLHREIYTTDQSIDLGEERLRVLTSRQAALDTLRNQQEKALRSDLVAMYKSGNEEPIKILLNQEDPAKLSRMLIYYRYLLEARSTKIDAYTKTINEIEDNQSNVDQQNNQLTEMRSTLKQQETSLTASLARRARLVDRLASRIQSAEQQIADRKENAHQLEQLILDAAEQIANLARPETYRPFVDQKGQYNWPVAGQISHRFNAARTGDVQWQGVVLSSPEGSEVQSIHHGRVVFSDYLRGYGLLVIIDHEDGYMTLYGHNQALFVEPGDWVNSRDQLALVGNTGGLPETGLYFEIRQNGNPLNPAQWCSS